VLKADVFRALITAHVNNDIAYDLDADRLITLANEYKDAREREATTKLKAA
jgi:hypothetical protein